ncbi:hypothetical protein KDH_72040 [Dictyobacter sp. S3.2.2.5]|uniref:Uncharacterized protein n=1 Tax=Dictyobacter halimunensis TaxID=3026934 RepID=A0ABQ6G2Z9_9CHLR|nr:hypothetical protein KDH_72040 [Dictyobacter sp. S3.2.2.5]
MTPPEEATTERDIKREPERPCSVAATLSSKPGLSGADNRLDAVSDLQFVEDVGEVIRKRLRRCGQSFRGRKVANQALGNGRTAGQASILST